MAVDLWFPLAIYYEDLADASQHKEPLTEAIYALAADSVDASRRTAWTGDIGGRDRLHHDPRFDWLTTAVGEHSWKYLAELGHDLDTVDLHIQRSWPVVTKPGQVVDGHAHHNAHLSAVYYVTAPCESGRLRFRNTSNPNELSPGSSDGATVAYRARNAYNFNASEYEPVEGRLVLFPSKQPHQVLRNESDQDRLSISFDLVLSTRFDRPGGEHEYLMPPPEIWKRIERHTASGMIELRADAPMPLHLVAGDLDREHDYSLVDRTGSPLWESVVLRNCTSAADWQRSRAAADAAAAYRDGPPATPLVDPDEPNWQVFLNATRRTHHHLSRDEVPLSGAQVLPPIVETLSADNTERPFARAGTDLALYVRLDRSDAVIALEFFEQPELVALEPGALAVISGYRRHRLVGSGAVMCFGMNLPALARPEAAAHAAQSHDELSDLLAFAAATVLPLSAAPPSVEATAKMFDRFDRRERLRRRQECAVSRRYLIDGRDPSLATDEECEVVQSYAAGSPASTAVDPAPRHGVLNRTRLLDAHQCEQLVEYARTHMTSIVPDTVDDAPEYQVNLDRAQLIELVGPEAAELVLALPDRAGTGPLRRDIEPSIFVRLFTPDTRDHLAFHSDISGATVNIALEPLGASEGGDLVMLVDGRLCREDRRRGVALIHDSRLVHGVSRMKAGERWSLIAFFPPAPSTESSLRPTANPQPTEEAHVV